jgi:hypothetical protein
MKGIGKTARTFVKNLYPIGAQTQQTVFHLCIPKEDLAKPHC